MLCGHRDFCEEIGMRMMPALETLVSACGVDNFLLGNQGGFDRAGLFALQEIKRRDPRIQYTVVLAYLPSRVAKATHGPCRGEREKHPAGCFFYWRFLQGN
jgi:hypothetical protein